MAEEEEQLKDDILYPSPNTLISWERIHLPPLPTQSQSQSPVILLSDPHAGDGTWSTQIEHHTSVVFPPTNHEGLNIIHHCSDVQEKLDERPKPLPPVSIGLKPAAIGGPIAVKWWFLQFKLTKILSYIWNLGTIRGGLLRLFSFPLIGSTVVVLLFYLSCRLRRRRRRLREETVDGLLGVIREKDERIHHLLQQIARLNELLLVSHHGAPMISKASST